MVSVIITFFAEWDYIQLALKSLQIQNFKNLEIVIIDDSVEEYKKLTKILKKFDNLNINYFKNKKNIGLGKSRNIGIKLAKGKYICFLDSDDEYPPNRIKFQYDIIKEKNYDIIYGNEIILKNNEYFIRKADREFTLKKLLGNLYINLSTLMISKKLLIKNNIFFSDDSRYGEDLEFLILIASYTNNILYIDKTFSIIRRRENNHRSYSNIWNEFEKKEKQFSSYLNNKFFNQYRSIILSKLYEVKLKLCIAYKIAGLNNKFKSQFFKIFYYLSFKDKFLLLILYLLPSFLALFLTNFIIKLKNNISYKKIKFNNELY